MPSKPRIAILTPDPTDEGHLTRWPEVLAIQAAPLQRAGMMVEGRSWAEPNGLADFGLVLPLLVWGYHRAGAQWRRTVGEWEEKGVRLQNPPSVLRWNADKTYLGRLADLGAPVVPTIYVDKLSEGLLHEAAARFDAVRLIAKPQASASAWQTIVWEPGRSLEGGPAGAAMIQPYLPSITTAGEISLVFIDGVFSHAIDKKPRQGDFRVQPEHGATITRHDPAIDELEAAELILDRIEENLLYARIDLVRDLDGRPALMELELVEPDLYLEHDPRRGAAFVEAVARAAGL